MAKNTEERLTEVITAVLIPRMRAHLDHACRTKGNASYAYLVREALQSWLEQNDPLTEKELDQLKKQWITDHPHGNTN